MIAADFFENFPLFKLYKYSPEYDPNRPDLGGTGSSGTVSMIPDHYFELPVLRLKCDDCASDHTFRPSVHLETRSSRSIRAPADIYNHVVPVTFTCSACRKFRAWFMLLIDTENCMIQKLGQYPKWEHRIASELESYLGPTLSLMRKGKICEGNELGLAAVAYYRRVIEDTLQKLYEDVVEILPEQEAKQLRGRFGAAPRSTSTKDRIDIMKEYLPPQLLVDGNNPMSSFYSLFSEGIHQKTEDECLHIAGDAREDLEFFVATIQQHKAMRTRYQQRMRKR